MNTAAAGYRSAFRADLLAGQVIVVTGGGSGIGRCTAHELAALGATPVLVGRTLAKLEGVRAELAERGCRAGVQVIDIRDGTRGARGRGRDPGRTRPHRRPGQQRRGPVPEPAGEHLRQGLGRRGAQQPQRQLQHDARGLHAVDARAWRRHRRRGRAGRLRLPEHGPHRRRAGRRDQPDADRGARMGAPRRARQRRRAGLDHRQRPGHLQRRSSSSG